MKSSIFTFVLLFAALSVSAQNQSSQAKLKSGPNDTTYMRIVNGIVSDNEQHVGSFKSISYIRDKQDLAKLNVSGKKPVMILELESSDMEDKIDSILYSRPDFVNTYKYSLSIQLPISINGKLLPNEQRASTLNALDLGEIKEIEYLDSEHTSVDRSLTPFGVINLRID